MLVGSATGGTIWLMGSWQASMGWHDFYRYYLDDSEGARKLVGIDRAWSCHRLGRPPIQVTTGRLRRESLNDGDAEGDFRLLADINDWRGMTNDETWLAVSSGHGTRHPKVRKLPLNDRAVVGVVLDVLKRRALPRGIVRLTSHWAVDLDGDGIDDELLAAAIEFPPDQHGNQYTGGIIIALHRVADRGPEISVVTDDIERALTGGQRGYRPLEVYSAEIVAIEDINADSRCEVAFVVEAPDYWGFEVSTFAANRFRRVLGVPYGLP